MDVELAITAIVKSFLEPLTYIYEEEDEDILEMLIKLAKTTSVIESSRQPIKSNNYISIEHVPTLSSTQFQHHFRMLPSTFELLLREIGEQMNLSIRGTKMIAPDKQLMLTLWRFATSDSYTSMIERFDISIATAVKTVRRISKAICALSSKYIVWPTMNKIPQIVLGFFDISGFPNIIGALDSTCICIYLVKNDANNFVDKGHYSIHLQAVCDHTGLFTNIYIGNAGLTSNERVFRFSTLHEYIKDSKKFPDNTHLIGNTDYSLHKYLMTPYFDNKRLIKRQKKYNSYHSAGRKTIRKAFAYLIHRWRSLKDPIKTTQTNYVSCHIQACCVLHNICLLNKDDLEELKHIELELQDDVTVAQTDLTNEEDQYSGIEVAKMKRESICRSLNSSFLTRSFLERQFLTKEYTESSQ